MWRIRVEYVIIVMTNKIFKLNRMRRRKERTSRRRIG